MKMKKKTWKQSKEYIYDDDILMNTNYTTIQFRYFLIKVNYYTTENTD